MSKAFYAVRVGVVPGVYSTWSECEQQIRGISGAKFKKFVDYHDAVSFVNGTYQQPQAQSTSVATISPGTVEIYTDGSCFNNGSTVITPTGGIGVYFGSPSDVRNISEPLPPNVSHTNQYAELLAIDKALGVCLVDPKIQAATFIVIHTDSMYSINCVVRWYDGWAARGFRLASGEPVKHLSLIQSIRSRIDELGGRERVKFNHVRGHSKIEGNEQADILARAGASKNPPI